MGQVEDENPSPPPSGQQDPVRPEDQNDPEEGDVQEDSEEDENDLYSPEDEAGLFYNLSLLQFVIRMKTTLVSFCQFLFDIRFRILSSGSTVGSVKRSFG